MVIFSLRCLGPSFVAAFAKHSPPFPSKEVGEWAAGMQSPLALPATPPVSRADEGRKEALTRVYPPWEFSPSPQAGLGGGCYSLLVTRRPEFPEWAIACATRALVYQPILSAGPLALSNSPGEGPGVGTQLLALVSRTQRWSGWLRVTSAK